MDEPYNSASKPRTVVRQGALVKILRAEPKKYAGGGKRKAQHGHTKRSERTLYTFLLTCRPAKYVAWLTFPHIQGPGKVEAQARSFLKRIEKHTDVLMPALIKMEIQRRLAPELGIVLWPPAQVQLNENELEDFWGKTIKAQGRVRLEQPRDWYKLASYLSKQVLITDLYVVVGSKKQGFIEPADSDFIKRAHKDTKSSIKYLVKRAHKDTKSSIKYLGPEYMGQRGAFRQVKEEWIDYKGRFNWKYRRSSIPLYPKIMYSVPDGLVAPIRSEINDARAQYTTIFPEPRQRLVKCRKRQAIRVSNPWRIREANRQAA